ncbi:MAG: hypothetical protein C4562_03480 [Actinobacteria bacterium]|nr:MAG: hypothetical protein C4562_03480 [Actinomycetota bacterium]
MKKFITLLVLFCLAAMMITNLVYAGSQSPQWAKPCRIQKNTYWTKLIFYTGKLSMCYMPVPMSKAFKNSYFFLSATTHATTVKNENTRDYTKQYDCYWIYAKATASIKGYWKYGSRAKKYFKHTMKPRADSNYSSKVSYRNSIAHSLGYWQAPKGYKFQSFYASAKGSHALKIRRTGLKYTVYTKTAMRRSRP